MRKTLTVRQASKLTGLSVHQLYGLIKARAFDVFRVPSGNLLSGTHYQIFEDSLDAFMKAHTQPAVSRDVRGAVLDADRELPKIAEVELFR